MRAHERDGNPIQPASRELHARIVCVLISETDEPPPLPLRVDVVLTVEININFGFVSKLSARTIAADTQTHKHTQVEKSAGRLAHLLR